MGKYAHNKGYIEESYGKQDRSLEHRRVMENYLGRKLLSSEIVHHINEDKTDNRIENLYLWYTITSKNKSKLKKAIPLYPSPYFHVSQWVKQRQKLFTVATVYIVYIWIINPSSLIYTTKFCVYWPRNKP